MEQVIGPDAETLYVDRHDGRVGQNGPFFVVYADEDGTQRWGFFCGHCETADTAVDSMGRVQCNDCSNRTKAEEWDAAHE